MSPEEDEQSYAPNLRLKTKTSFVGSLVLLSTRLRVSFPVAAAALLMEAQSKNARVRDISAPVKYPLVLKVIRSPLLQRTSSPALLRHVKHYIQSINQSMHGLSHGQHLVHSAAKMFESSIVLFCVPGRDITTSPLLPELSARSISKLSSLENVRALNVVRVKVQRRPYGTTDFLAPYAALVFRPLSCRGALQLLGAWRLVCQSLQESGDCYTRVARSFSGERVLLLSLTTFLEMRNLSSVAP